MALFSRGLKHVVVVAVLALGLQGCAVFHQPGVESNRIYSKIFLIDYNTAWQSTLDGLRSFEKVKQNRAGGIIQTAWIDNTAEKSFTDSFGGQDTFIKSRFRMTVAVAPGTYKGKPSVKVSVEKEQQLQRDALDGWKPVAADAIDENTILYRIARLIYMNIKLKKMEEAKVQEAVEQGI